MDANTKGVNLPMWMDGQVAEPWQEGPFPDAPQAVGGIQIEPRRTHVQKVFPGQFSASLIASSMLLASTNAAFTWNETTAMP